MSNEIKASEIIRAKPEAKKDADGVPRIEYPASDTETIEINGNKVIAFANAVQKLGKMFEELNIIELHKLFAMHKQVGSVERILDQKRTWMEAMDLIRITLAKDLAGVQESRDNLHTIRREMESFKTCCTGMKESIATVKELVDLCDRLQKHKESGILDLLASLK